MASHGGVTSREFQLWHDHVNERFDNLFTEIHDIKNEMRTVAMLVRDQNGRLYKAETKMDAFIESAADDDNRLMSWRHFKWFIILVITVVTTTVAIIQFFPMGPT